jgi:hypothetical protein
MNQIKVKVIAKTPNGERAINELIEEKELAKGMNILRRKDLSFNQKIRFMRGSKLSAPVLKQVELEDLGSTPRAMNFCFNVFSNTEIITATSLKKNQKVEVCMATVGATPDDYEVDYGF